MSGSRCYHVRIHAFFLAARLLWATHDYLCLHGFSPPGCHWYLLLQLVPAWLRDSGVSLAEIGLFALVGLPYTWKVMWAPLMDRFHLPLGLRRGWMLLTQIGLLLSIGFMGSIDPAANLSVVAFMATVIAVFSASSQDVAIDAYRRDLLIRSRSSVWKLRPRPGLQNFEFDSGLHSH